VTPIPDENDPGWYQRFVQRLDPAERMGEVLFGLIMVLTFTLGAGIQLREDPDAARHLLIAAIGCNAAWGVIDAALYLIGRVSERGRIHRLARTLQSMPDREQALALVRDALDDRIPEFVSREMRAELDAHVLERVRGLKLARNRLGLDDLWAGLAVFWLVFFTALPAALPFLFIAERHVAMRVSNAILIGMLFYAGQAWGAYTGASRWGTGLLLMTLGVALVLVAIALGG